METRIFLFSILIHALCGCREVIVHNLGETEANKMLTQLVVNQLEARKEKQPDGKWSLSLPPEQSSQAIRYLYENRLLREEPSSLPEKSGLMLSREEQRFRYERALSREIEGTLSGLSAVLQARVHLNLPVMDPLFGQSIDNSKSSASVLLVLGDQSVDKEQISALVAGASGIPVNSISVMISKGIVQEDKNKSIQITLMPADAVVTLPVKDPESSKDRITSVYSQLTKILSKWKIFVTSLPWALMAMGTGVSLILVAVFRFVNRREKIVI